MGAIGPWQIILVIVLAVLLFGGRGRVSSIMGDFADGIKSFRKGLKDDKSEPPTEALDTDRTIDVVPEEMPAREEIRERK